MLYSSHLFCAHKKEQNNCSVTIDKKELKKFSFVINLIFRGQMPARCRRGIRQIAHNIIFGW